jgi:hypothetical protein
MASSTVRAHSVNSAVPSPSKWLDPPPQAGGPPWTHGQSQVPLPVAVLGVLQPAVRVDRQHEALPDLLEGVQVQDRCLFDQELLDLHVLLAPHRVRERVDQTGDHLGGSFRNRPVRLRGGDLAVDRRQEFAGERTTSSESFRGLDPGRGFRGADPQHVTGQQRDRLRPTRPRKMPRLDFLEQCVIDRRQAAPAAFQLAPQGEDFTVAAGGQLGGGEFIQDLVQARNQLRVCLVKVTVEHVSVLVHLSDQIKDFHHIWYARSLDLSRTEAERSS